MRRPERRFYGESLALVDEIRERARWVAERARSVRVKTGAVVEYAEALPDPGSDAIGGGGFANDSGNVATGGGGSASGAGDEVSGFLAGESRETAAAFHLTLDAINFGSGWFPTLRKREGRSGYFTVALGVRDRFIAHGPWSAAELARIDVTEIAATLGQDPGHELIRLFVASLHDLGNRIELDHGGRFLGPVDAGGASAPRLVETLASWDCFADRSVYDGREVPIYKRAQITVSDLALAGAAEFTGLDRLTLFADNLIPHVLRLDGVLEFEPELVRRIEAGKLLAHGSPEEVEMRCGAIHAAELIVAARPDLTARAVDQILWTQGGGAHYKMVPRPRCRCTAY